MAPEEVQYGTGSTIQICCFSRGDSPPSQLQTYASTVGEGNLCIETAERDEMVYRESIMPMMPTPRYQLIYEVGQGHAKRCKSNVPSSMAWRPASGSCLRLLYYV